LTVSDNGTGTLTFPTDTIYGGFKINGGQTQGFVVANAATPGSANSDILDPGGNILITSSSAALSIKLTETGLVAQDVPIGGFYFDPGLTLAPGSTMSVATFVDTADIPFGVATPIGLTATSAPLSVAYTNNNDGSVTFVNHDTVHRKTVEADNGVFSPVAMSAAGGFSVTEIITLMGPVSSTQARISGSFTTDPPVYAPEPGALALFGVGLLGLGLVSLKRRLET